MSDDTPVSADGSASDASDSATTDPDPQVLADLFAVIEDRKATRPKGSYTASLFDHEKGENAVLEKIGEESTEVVLAAKDDDSDELAAESADLVYHLLVLLSMQEMDLADLLSALESRR